MRVEGMKSSLKLSDVTEITRGFADPPGVMARYNGEPCIMLAISMADGNNIMEVGELVTAKLEKLSKNLYHAWNTMWLYTSRTMLIRLLLIS